MHKDTRIAQAMVASALHFHEKEAVFLKILCTLQNVLHYVIQQFRLFGGILIQVALSYPLQKPYKILSSLLNVAKAFTMSMFTQSITMVISEFITRRTKHN